MSELDKMLAGELYRPYDPELVTMRKAARLLTAEFNASSPVDEALRRGLLPRLFGRCGENVYVEPPFRCDYGIHISLGNRVYLNFDCVFLDCARITIGDDVMFAPGVHLYAATHPLNAAERIKGPELAAPITIGDRCWIGGRSLVLPGVTIGENTTIGAGSVVTRDIPSNVVAAGNPCRVLRRLEG
ncbi:MAG: sugar O-acetyltransferase [Planctomycetota bacterium]|nr:sugar O-acetyltransferase [Planctomycetaceae bacterium]MDQ3332851.1 sugar O-acetyltransferase [Planctomycetota bacterium]